MVQIFLFSRESRESSERTKRLYWYKKFQEREDGAGWRFEIWIVSKAELRPSHRRRTKIYVFRGYNKHFICFQFHFHVPGLPGPELRGLRSQRLLGLIKASYKYLESRYWEPNANSGKSSPKQIFLRNLKAFRLFLNFWKHTRRVNLKLRFIMVNFPERTYKKKSWRKFKADQFEHLALDPKFCNLSQQSRTCRFLSLLCSLQVNSLWLISITYVFNLILCVFINKDISLLMFCPELEYGIRKYQNRYLKTTYDTRNYRSAPILKTSLCS